MPNNMVEQHPDNNTCDADTAERPVSSARICRRGPTTSQDEDAGPHVAAQRALLHEAPLPAGGRRSRGRGRRRDFFYLRSPRHSTERPSRHRSAGTPHRRSAAVNQYACMPVRVLDCAPFVRV